MSESFPERPPQSPRKARFAIVASQYNAVFVNAKAMEAGHITRDPIELVHRYKRADDQEIEEPAFGKHRAGLAPWLSGAGRPAASQGWRALGSL